MHPPFDSGKRIEAGIVSAKAYCIAIPALLSSPYNKAKMIGYGLSISFTPLSFLNSEIERVIDEIDAIHRYR